MSAWVPGGKPGRPNWNAEDAVHELRRRSAEYATSNMHRNAEHLHGGRGQARDDNETLTPILQNQTKETCARCEYP